MDNEEQASPQTKVVPGMVTLVLPESVAETILESLETAREGDEDVSGYMLNMGIGASRLNASSTTYTTTSPCTHTTVGNGDLNCDVDEWVQY